MQGSNELPDTIFSINSADLYNPVINICLGVRWLFRKREIAKIYYKSEPNYLQLADEYKGIRNDKSVGAKNQRTKFEQLWNEYESFDKKK